MNTSKLTLFVLLGAIFWFMAAMIVRVGGASFFSENLPINLTMLAITVPLSYVFYFITMKAARLSLGEMLEPFVIMNGVAMCLDGIALTWFPKLYGDTHEIAHFGAAAIIFGAGMVLFLAHMHESKVDRDQPLTTYQRVIFPVLGVIFWFMGAMTVRLLGEGVFTEGNPLRIVAFLAIIPLVYTFIFIIQRLGKVKMQDILKPFAIVTYAAILLDGWVLSTYRQLYGSSFEHTHYGVAWILWGGGVGLLVAYILRERSKKAHAVQSPEEAMIS